MEKLGRFKRKQEVTSGTIKGISGGNFRKFDGSFEQDISDATKNTPDITSNTDVFDDPVITLEKDINTTRGGNADADDFVKYTEQNDGKYMYVTLSMSPESFNSNDNTEPNKHPKKKMKDKQRNCKQSEVSESSSNTIWYVPDCSDHEKSETGAECLHFCRMCKSKLEASEVNKADVEIDSQTHGSARNEKDLLDSAPIDDTSPNTLIQDMETLLDAVQKCFKKVTGMNGVMEEQSSSEQSNKYHTKITEAILKIYQIMDIAEGTQSQPAETKALKINQQLKRQREDITNITNQNHALMSTVQELSKVRKELEIEIGRLQDEKGFLLAQSREMDQKLKCLKEELSMTRKEFEIKVEKLQDEKESLITRLSTIAGSRLKDGNPIITDLSDDNRPLKIAERFSEIYDNEWTDVFDNLITDKSERESIHILLEILQSIFKSCQEISEDQLQNLKGFGIIQDDDAEDMSRDPDTYAGERKAKEMQMLCGSLSAELVQMKILRNPDFSTKFSDYIITCETFIKKCIKTCWMMNMQEVPMCLKFAYQTGDPFKKELYKEYTKCGGQCGYLVWPLLLLHVDGPVLQKGVMQPL